jgi:DNA (cytosine-5)-methyltransferase 1
MKFGSLFSGIGGFDLGFERAGMTPAWQCEIDKAASGVLNRHWTNVPNIGDVRDVRRNTVGSVDVLCGGFPCQDVSIAGKRAGLAGERSGLWFEFARVIDELGPRTVVIENVPGLLSSNDGRDFAVILSGLVQFGYGVCWRVLDAQYFGVPQRRRRVFIVGSLGDGRAAEILFERESMSGNIAPSREAGEGFTGIAGTLSANGGGLDRPAGNANELDFCVPIGIDSELNADENMIGAIRSHQSGGSELYVAAFQQNTRDEVRLIGGDGQIVGALSSQAGMKQQNYVMAHGQANAEIVSDGSPSLTRNHEAPILINLVNSGANQNNVKQADVMDTLDTWAQFAVQRTAGIRRLTPTECERLQGFPDGWTAGQADTARYRQLGNAVAVPVAEWLGKRIMESS